MIGTLALSGGVTLASGRALYLEEHQTLVVADLHLGMEAAMQTDGVEIPRYQGPIVRERIAELLEHFHPERIVIDGDFKHNFSRNLEQEWIEVRDVLHTLMKTARVDLVKGNHDNFLATMASEVGVSLRDRLELGQFLLVHGHEPVAPEKGQRVVVGHEHPAIVLRDKVGGRVKLPCFLVGPSTLALPAFSPLAEGTDVTTSLGSRAGFCPPIEAADPAALKVYAINEDEVLPFATLAEIRSLQPQL